MEKLLDFLFPSIVLVGMFILSAFFGSISYCLMKICSMIWEVFGSIWCVPLIIVIAACGIAGIVFAMSLIILAFACIIEKIVELI